MHDAAGIDLVGIPTFGNKAAVHSTAYNMQSMHTILTILQ